jgi:hypothetical protein
LEQLVICNDKFIIYEGDECATPGLAALVAVSANGYCAVERTYSNILKLEALDLDTPDPMEDYEWPCQPGAEPFITQKQVSSFMVRNPRSFVVSDLRTGKTRASLWAADWLMSTAARQLRCLVLSDINALEGTWANEITTHFLGRRSFEMLHHAQAEKRLVALDREADFYLCNPDGLRMGRPKRVVEKTPEGKIKRVYHSEPSGFYAALLAKKFDIIIFDEATTYRETGTETFKCALQLSKMASFVYLLTGTPTPNGPLDAFGLKHLAHPTYKLNFKTWRDMTTDADGPFRRKPRPEAVTLVDELLQPSIRIIQDQCFTPTTLGVLDLMAPLSSEQKAAMSELKTELSFMVEEGEVNAVNQAALRSKLIQISCGAVYDQEHKSHLIPAPQRLAMLRQLVAEIPGKIIVFAPLTSVLRLLQTSLGETCTLIDNSFSKQRKLRLLRDWQTSPTSRVLLSHPGPVARGIDLSMANTIIWYAPIDRTEYFIQANERINGINQTRARYIIRMYGCEIERKIYERLESNQALQGLILQLKEMKI